MKRPIFTILASLVFTSASAQAANIIARGTNDILIGTGKTHTLEVRCDTQENAVKISRLAVLSVPEAGTVKLDFGITTAHGLLDSSGMLLKNCRVLDFEGQEYDLKTTKIAKNYAPGDPTDWALIVFERARNTDVIRYALAKPLSIENYDKLAEARLPLMFSSARGLGNNDQHCSALPRRFIGMNKARYVGLLPHNCKAISGQSGAPVSITREGQNVIFGFHVGSAFWMGIPNVTKPAKHGYMRVIDDRIMTDINTSIAALLQKP
jgi:hypothetical protein